ncbi:hypothetical protein B0H17DRAFT_1124732 [Mycena rosella]|uniref:Uncharacterized protein n=1 Tax=Mycena rosella TaxID=1033263 RepID=A0AAD7MBA9_MYCRO|nr:hypothetical protein B0H17DRAFT_1124732 [Mycena rosella]
MPPTRSRIPKPPQLNGPPRADYEPFNATQHPNCRVTELFAQAGFARVTLEQIESMFEAAGHSPDAKRAALIETVLRDVDAALDAAGGRIRYLGLKPEAANGPVGDVFFVDLPDDPLSIWFFPGDSRPEDGMFFFDFYDRVRRLACNAPSGYELEIIAPGGLAGPIRSVEAVYGVEAPEGLEKFAVVELTTCTLARPGMPSFAFEVPRRTRHRPLVAQPVRDPYM